MGRQAKPPWGPERIQRQLAEWYRKRRLKVETTVLEDFAEHAWERIEGEHQAFTVWRHIEGQLSILSTEAGRADPNEEHVLDVPAQPNKIKIDLS